MKQTKLKNLNEKKWKTGDLVLYKVGKYEPWPAVVFPEYLLSKEVIRKKKKEHICVCFFNDPTYYWALPRKLIPLTKTSIDEFLINFKKSKEIVTDIVGAYKMAKKYVNLNKFAIQRLEYEGRKKLLKSFDTKEIPEGEDINVDKPGGVVIPSVKSKIPGKKRGRKPKSITTETVIIPEEPIIKKRKDKVMKPILANKKELLEGRVGSRTRHTIDLSTEYIAGIPAVKKRKPKPEQTNNNDNKTTTTTTTTPQPLVKKPRPMWDIKRSKEIVNLLSRRLQILLLQRDEPLKMNEIKEFQLIISKISANSDEKDSVFDHASEETARILQILKCAEKYADLSKYHGIIGGAIKLIEKRG